MQDHSSRPDFWGNDFHKVCSRCKKVKPLSEFYKGKGRFGRDPYCKLCKVQVGCAYAKTSAGIKRAKKANKKRNLKKYSLTPESYWLMLKSQNGVCAICKKEEATVNHNGVRNPLGVDHCHVTGKVRGLLCSKCNPGVGIFLDSPALLRAAADYLERNA